MTPQCAAGFQALKHKLISSPNIALPLCSPSDPLFILDTDVGTVILRPYEDVLEHVIASSANHFSPSKHNYTTTHQNLSAVYIFARKFKKKVKRKKNLNYNRPCSTTAPYMYHKWHDTIFNLV